MLVMTMTRLQMNLKFLNYYFGTVDGVKGAQTKQAIREFRVNNGLSDSDIADQQMIDVLRDLICRIQDIIGCTADRSRTDKTQSKIARDTNESII
jgi:peptidoglycan hydrolase-like protein with peptidoglycan-binding domain